MKICVPLLPVLLLLVLCSCHQTVTHLSNEAIRDKALYQPIFEDTCTGGAKHPVPAKITGITVYRTRFDEKFVESGSVLSIASLNNNSNRPTATYKGLIGYRQELFLVRLQASCHPESWVYFSVVYRPDTKRPGLVQEGFGKAYLGTANPGNGTIYFDRALSFGHDKNNGYYLQKRSATQFLLVTDGLGPDQDEVAINRIVIEEKNKFAGPNPFVFVVGNHFRGELDRLRFKRVGA